MVKPVKELKGFAKTGEIAPGASETVTVDIPRKLLASYNEYWHKWVVEPGEYHFIAAPSSADQGISAAIDVK